MKRIALFGATGSTGSEFLKLALGAGHSIKALVRTPSKLEEIMMKNNENEHSSDTSSWKQQEGLTIIQGSIEDEDKVRETVQDADYVISMIGIKMEFGGNAEYPKDTMLNYAKALHRSMLLEDNDQHHSNPKSKVLLWQAGAVNLAPGETTSQLSWIPYLLRNGLSWMNPYIVGYFQDHENTFEYFKSSSMQESHINIIVTRPGGLKHGTTTDKDGTKLKAVPSPPIGMITYHDLAQFSLDAIDDKDLYGTYPYVA